MHVLDLFSGIGGFSLGLERAGMKTISFCEIDPFCRRVLAKHWPGVPCYHDVRELSAQHLTADGIGDIDLICGGFPCQDISIAGDGAGLAGQRSGLWSEFARLIGEVQPRYAIVENVSALLHRGLGDVLGDLAALGYNAEWDCIPASALGAQHDRERIWIVAYPDGSRELQPEGGQQKQRGWAGDFLETSPDADQPRLSWRLQAGTHGPDAGAILQRLRSAIRTAAPISRDYWNHKPVLGRGLHGIPHRVDRVGALGNSLVPQIPELIGRAIMECENHG